MQVLWSNTLPKAPDLRVFVYCTCAIRRLVLCCKAIVGLRHAASNTSEQYVPAVACTMDRACPHIHILYKHSCFVSRFTCCRCICLISFHQALNIWTHDALLGIDAVEAGNCGPLSSPSITYACACYTFAPCSKTQTKSPTSSQL